MVAFGEGDEAYEDVDGGAYGMDAVAEVYLEEAVGMMAFVGEPPVVEFAEDYADMLEVDWQGAEKDVALVAKEVLDEPASALPEKYQLMSWKVALQLLHRELYLHFVPVLVEKILALLGVPP